MNPATASLLVATSASIPMVLGIVHLVFTFFDRKLSPGRYWFRAPFRYLLVASLLYVAGFVASR